MAMLTVVLMTLMMLVRGQADIESDLAKFRYRKASVSSKYLKAYRGWPHRIPCIAGVEALSENLDFINFEYDEFGELKFPMFRCVISNETGATVSDQTDSLKNFEASAENFGYVLENVDDYSLLHYKLYFIDISDKAYLRLDFNIEVTDLPQSSCEEFFDQIQSEFTFNVGETETLGCYVDDTDFPQLVKAPGLKFEWLHDCSPTLKRSQLEVDHKQRSVLRLNKLGFDQVGDYVCRASYNGMFRYIRSYKVCVREPLELQQLSTECDATSLKQNNGWSGQLSCTVDYGQGNINPNHVRVSLNKIDGESSEIKCFESKVQTNTTACVYGIESDQIVCHSSSNHTKVGRAIVHVNISFNNIGEEDYGLYVLTSQNRHKTSESQLFISNFTFRLERDSVPNLVSSITLISSTIASLFFLTTIILFILYNTVYIRVFYKRYFGVYIIDDKEYGALLAYNFSHDMDKITRDHVRLSIHLVRDLLESKGYRVHDENKDGFISGNRIESIETSFEKCHRVIIFLTVNFIKDEWAMLALQKGFEEMINCRSKLIFILLPGIKEYLKEHAKDDDSCIFIQRAIKLNYAIQLPSKLNEKRLKYVLEDAMPKLHGGAHSATLSISSRIEFESSKPPHYQRCFSNDTNITIIDSSEQKNFPNV